MTDGSDSQLNRSKEYFEAYVARFIDDAALACRVVAVLIALPTEVQQDLTEDAGFSLALEDFVPGRGSVVWLECPIGLTRGHRSVVLRPRLRSCDAAFAHYIIAHELAHAYLWNGGWGEITDREHAADALAASWGFPRPTSWLTWPSGSS